MRTITETEARTILLPIIVDAIAPLPTTYRGPHAKSYIDESLTRFSADTGVLSSLHLEFGTSFHVTASLSIETTRIDLDGSLGFDVKVGYASGMKTLSQAQAAHNLIGDLLKAAHTIQAAIDSLPTIERKKK